jgi:hypothetical protein
LFTGEIGGSTKGEKRKAIIARTEKRDFSKKEISRKKRFVEKKIFVDSFSRFSRGFLKFL